MSSMMIAASDNADEEHEDDGWFIFQKANKQRSSIDMTFTHLTFDPSVRVIPKSVFANHPLLQSVKIPKTVKKIGQEAFCNCENLLTVEFPDGGGSLLKIIDKRAFQHCSSLKDIRIPDSVKVIGLGAFQGCDTLSGVQLPRGLKIFGDSMFRGCTALLEIDLPDGLLKIEDGAFYECMSLRNVKIPTTVKVIGSFAFAKCRSVVSLGAFPRCSDDAPSRRAPSIPSGLKVLEQSTFFSCTTLVEIDLPSGLSRIEDSAFRKCESLENVKMPDTVKVIGRSAFEECRSLTLVELPRRLKKICKCTFFGCELLSGIVLPSSLEEIEYQAFMNCYNLLGVEFAKDIRHTLKIDLYAFARCSSLVNVCIPDTVTSTTSFFDRFFQSSPPSSVHVESSPFPSNCRLHDGQDGYDHCNIRNRFADLPIHSLCYHASVTTVDQLKQALDDDAGNNDLQSTDYLGMTPFHIVATSANPRIDLLECLLSNKKDLVDILSQKDSRGCTMVDFLLIRNARGIPALQLVLHKAFAKWIWNSSSSGSSSYNDDDDDETAESTAKEMDLNHSIELLASECFIKADPKTKRQRLREIWRRVGFHMQNEPTTLLELACWNKKIVEVISLVQNKEPRGCSSTISNHQDNIINRETCRYQCGAQVVIDNVTAYWNSPDDESSKYLSTALEAFPLCTSLDETQV